MYCLMSMSNYFNSQSRGAAQKGIYLKQLRSFTIKYPDLEEQQRIVSILDRGFDGIKNAKHQLEKKIMQIFLRGGIQKSFQAKMAHFDWLNY
mgnify:CR=1 FL=1